MPCHLCPRSCNADRENGKAGYCKVPSTVKIARAALHYWEEPCISGETGSGAVFFSGCPLQCVFCQNIKIANGTIGKEISLNRLSEIFLELQEKKAANINLVTPTQYIPQIVQALQIAKSQGLRIPIVYNTGSYETVESLKQLDGLIDIYLPDLKYFSPKLAAKYSNAPDYYEVASSAIAEMYHQVGAVRFDSETKMLKSGMIVRHLLLPRHLADSKKVIQYLYESYGDSIYISIMSQYTPMRVFPNMPELSRRVSRKEYQTLIDYSLSLGIEQAFIQDGDVAEESFIPAFDYEGV